MYMNQRMIYDLGYKIPFVAAIYAFTFLLHGVIEDRYLRDAWSFFAIILLYNTYIRIVSRGDLVVFLYPSVICINYIYISMFVGAIGFYSGNIIVPHMKSAPNSWGNGIVPMLFFSSIVCVMILFSRYKLSTSSWLIRLRAIEICIASLIFMYIAIYVFIINEFNFGPQVIGAIFCIYILYASSIKQRSVRYFMYIIALIPLSFAMAQSKREAIFFIYAIFIIEAIVADLKKIGFRQIIWISAAIIAVVALILVITVVRASDAFGVNSINDVIPAVLYYISFDNFASYLLLNVEATYTYFHAMNLIELSMNEYTPILFGETYIKVLYLPISREWGIWKPNSAVDHYTWIFDPDFRAVGGSWAVSMFGEAFLNFRMAGVIVCVFILAVFDRVFRSFVLDSRRNGVLYGVGSIYFLVSVLTFSRGSGLDLAFIQWLVVMLTALPFAIVCNHIGGAYKLYLRGESPTSSGRIVRRAFLLPRKAARGQRAAPVPLTEIR